MSINLYTINELAVIVYKVIDEILVTNPSNANVADSYAKSILYRYERTIRQITNKFDIENLKNNIPRLYIGVRLVNTFNKFTERYDAYAEENAEDEYDDSDLKGGFKKYIMLYKKYKELDDIFVKIIYKKGQHYDEEDKEIGAGKLIKKFKKVKHNKYKGNKKEMIKKLSMKR